MHPEEIGLADAVGEPCHLVQNGAPTEPQLLVQLEAEGVRLTLEPGSRGPGRNPRGCLPCWRRPRSLLRYQDLLAVTPEAGFAATVRLVYCPRAAGRGRTRADLLLDFTEGSRAEAWIERANQLCARRPAQKHYLVLINPASGSGQAPAAWGIARELWAAVPLLSYEEVTTSRAGEARDRARQLNLSAYDGIVIVSGDGLVHEVLEGLASRADVQQALQMPLGHIPGGSGNGLAKSVLDNCGEHFGVLDAAFLVARGRCQPISLMTVQIADQPPSIAFLGLTGGVISDIDIESEVLRCCGGARFTLYALYRVLRPRALHAKLAYWPAAAPAPKPGTGPDMAGPLPEGPWITIEDHFLVFFGTNIAWPASDVHLLPGKAMADGTWSLVVMREASRMALARCLIGLESGSHIGQRGVEVIQCHAFRLTPLCEEGHFSLDGEVIPLGPVQVWPAPHNGRVLGAVS